MPGEWPDEVTQIRRLPTAGADRVLVADADGMRRAWLRNAPAGHYGVEEVDTGRAALERLAHNPPRVVIVGPELNDVSGGVLLEHASRHQLLAPLIGRPVAFLLGDNSDAVARVD